MAPEVAQGRGDRGLLCLGPPDDVVDLRLQVAGVIAAELADQRLDAGDRFEAADPTAAADRSVRINLDVADLAGVALPAPQQMSVGDDAGAHPGVPVEID